MRTIPVVFLWLASVERCARLHHEAVLIHSAAGGVELAAVQWARHLARACATAKHKRAAGGWVSMSWAHRRLPAVEEMRGAIGACVDIV